MTVLGLPLHPLIVHATVVAVPAALYRRLAATRPGLWSPARWSGAVVALVPVVGAVGALVEVVADRSQRRGRGLVGRGRRLLSADRAS